MPDITTYGAPVGRPTRCYVDFEGGVHVGNWSLAASIDCDPWRLLRSGATCRIQCKRGETWETINGEEVMQASDLETT